MSWLPKREKLDPVQASEYPPAVRPLAKQVARAAAAMQTGLTLFVRTRQLPLPPASVSAMLR